MKFEYVLLLKLLFCSLDGLMLCIFLKALFKRQVKKLKFLCNFPVMILVLVIIDLLNVSLLKFLAVPLSFFVFSILTFQISVHKGFIYTFIYYIVFCCGKEMAFEMLLRLLSAIFPQMNMMLTSVQGTVFLLAEYVFSFLFLIYVKRYISKIEIGEDNRFEWYMLIMPMASIMILFSFVYMDYPDDRYIQILMCGGAFLLYFSNIVIFIILAHFTDAMNRVKAAELSALKKDLEISNFENIEKMNIVYRKYMHDVHKYFNQIRYLAKAGENETIVNIIDGWEKGLASEKPILYTGSAVLDSILTEYSKKAGERDVEFSVSAEDNIKLDFISDTDKIPLFGNLLENALEAASKCDKNNRKIQIRLFMGSEYILVFQVKNTWIMDAEKEGMRLLSTKKNAGNHGLGVGIIRELAKKYEGNLELEELEEWFRATLMLSTVMQGN